MVKLREAEIRRGSVFRKLYIAEIVDMFVRQKKQTQSVRDVMGLERSLGKGIEELEEKKDKNREIKWSGSCDA
ncbi:MAG: hypothetical protein AUK19_01935 [Candidatus Moranbacteria bacterium CG2_30_45_14]|nr:MAG: hypothetical protein AUK19_01935 [Candidatus Moranbacteria bacterium CG2_30_45_14]